MFKLSIPFKFSLAMSVFLLLVSFFGGAPASVEAAPKPSNTPKPTRTVKPTKTLAPSQTPTSTLTLTFTPTWTATATNTLTFTPTFTDTPTNTPTATATAIPCGPISAGITPPGGEIQARTYTLQAFDGNGCSAPLQYFWQCASGANQLECNRFTSQANVGPYGLPSASLTIGENEDFILQVTICQIGTSNCSDGFVQYLGISAG